MSSDHSNHQNQPDRFSESGPSQTPYTAPTSTGPTSTTDLHQSADTVAVASSEEVKISSLISWTVIVLCTLFLMGTVYMGQFMTKAKSSDKPSMAQSELMVRMSMGMKPLPGGNAGQLLDELDSGPVPQRLARVILVGETASFEKAAGEIDALNEKMEKAEYSPTDSEKELIDSVKRIIQNQRFESQQQARAKIANQPAADTVKQSDQNDVKKSSTDESNSEIQPIDAAQLEKDLTRAKENLGFAGELAEAWQPGNKDKYDRLSSKTQSAVLGVIGIFGVGILSLAAGGILLIVMIVLIANGMISSLFKSPGTYGHIYLETFAIWILGFISLQLLAAFLMPTLGIDTAKDPTLGKLLTVFVFWSPLLALGWIFVRHPSPRQAFKDVGFTSHGILGDIGAGIVTYIACLPLLLVAMISTVVLTNLVWGDYTAANPFAPNPGPSHPIQDQFGGGIMSVLFLYFVAAVSAPIVEETVFRGLFFRYLRDASNRYGWWFSVLTASTVNAFFFAAIHPQGLLGIPPLLMLGVCMSLARQWREGLVAPMAIHALHNGTLVTVMTILMA